MVRFPVILAALATWILGCAAGDTGAPSYNNADASLNSDTKAIPPGADSPYPPDNTTPVAKPDVPVTPVPDTGPVDPCAAWRAKSGMMYRCTYLNGLSDICQVSLEIGPENECLVNCDPALYDYISKIRLRTDGQTFDYKTAQADEYDTVCAPTQ